MSKITHYSKENLELGVLHTKLLIQQGVEIALLMNYLISKKMCPRW